MRATSDYYVFERPYCTVSHALDVPFYSTHEALAGGEATRLSFRWEVEPQNLPARAMLTVVLPLVRRQLQQDVEDLTRTAAPQGARPQEEGRLRQQVAASGAGLARTLGWVSIGVGLAIVTAPGPLIKALGLGDRPNLGRFLEVRDLVLGTGLLRGQNTAAWCRAQGLADALDVALIIVGAATGAFRRDQAPIGVGSGAGFTALSFWVAR